MSLALKRVEDLGRQGRAKREQILAAARRLFLEHGFERTSMEAIREAARVSKPTLYNHYQGKETLFADVLREIADEIAGDWYPAAAASAESLQTRQELAEALRALAHHAVTNLMRPEYLALVRVIVSETPRFPHLGKAFRAAGPERGLTTIATLLEQCQARGIITLADPHIAARLLIGSILSYALTDGLIIAGEPRIPPSAQTDAVVELFMKALT